MKRSGVAGCLTIIRQDLDVAMVLCGQRDNRAVEAMVMNPAPQDLRIPGFDRALARLGARAAVAEEQTCLQWRAGAGERAPVQKAASTPAPAAVPEHSASDSPCCRRIMSAARSPMTTQGAMMLPTVMRGMIEASAIRSPSIP